MMEFSDISSLLPGILAIVGTMLLIRHMNLAWPFIIKTGQRMRYITLLWFCMAITYWSAGQYRNHERLESVGIMFAIGCVLLIITMGISIKETKETVVQSQ